MTPDNTTPHGTPLRRPARCRALRRRFSETPLQATDQVKDDKAPLSLWGEAWKNLRKQPLFIISAS